eukprot:364433-Chlamydomonas_euryale.AAC.4
MCAWRGALHAGMLKQSEQVPWVGLTRVLTGSRSARRARPQLRAARTPSRQASFDTPAVGAVRATPLFLARRKKVSAQVRRCCGPPRQQGRLTPRASERIDRPLCRAAPRRAERSPGTSTLLLARRERVATADEVRGHGRPGALALPTGGCLGVT